MKYEEKLDFAVKELVSAKILKSNYNAANLKLARKLGFEIPPSHYNTFLNNAFLNGIYFSITWGTIMYFISWNRENIPVAILLASTLFSGIFFGLAMASYYSHAFKKHKLTPWHQIENS